MALSLRFETLTSTYGNGHVGLNEIEVFGPLIPEPSSFILSALGLLGLLVIRRRRRRAA